MRIAGLITCLALTLNASLAVAASPDPSATDIINSLRPTGRLDGATRGLKPVSEPKSAPSINLAVQFASGAADLTPNAVTTLIQLGRALSSDEMSKYRFRIEGHTDTMGSDELNRTLSNERAHAVVDFLVTNFKVDPACLQPVGMGSDNLAVATGPQVDEPRNRRVQIVNIGEIN